MEARKIYIKQIKSYFNGQLSPAEEQDLFFWLKADNQNLLIFEEEKNKLQPEEIKHEMLESSLNELKMKVYLNDQFRPKPNKIKKLTVTLSQIAAVIILLIGLSFIFSLVLNEYFFSDTQIAWFETYAPRGEKTKLSLPDGSVVWLNSETTLRYPDNFGKENREVILNGEAYFEVEKQESSTFAVKTNDYTIEVLGTKFNVMAYEDFGRTETSLIEGKIRALKGEKAINLKPGQELIFKDSRFFIKEKNTAQSKVWKDNKFDFDQITFEELVRRLERWYDVDIVIKGDQLKGTIYSGIFKNEETIWQVLNTLKMTLPFSYHKTDFRKIEIITKK